MLAVALADLNVAVVVVSAVTAGNVLPTVLTLGVNCMVYTAENAVGNVTDPELELTDVLPHCINNPLGNLLCPGFAIEEVPNVKVLVLRVALAAVTAPVTDKFACAVTFPVTVNVLVIVAAAFTLTPVVFAMITFIVLLAPTVTVSVELITIDGPEVLPVLTVKLVEPSFVFIVVVVKLDIIRSPLFHLH